MVYGLFLSLSLSSCYAFNGALCGAVMYFRKRNFFITDAMLFFLHWFRLPLLRCILKNCIAMCLLLRHTHPCRYTNCAIKQSLWRWQISDRVATYCDDRNLILIVHIVPLKKFAARKFVQHTTKQIGGICVYLCLVRILYHTHKTKKNTLLHCRTTYNDAII